MGYAVCHREAGGALHVEDVPTLEAAVELVERLRNEDGPADVRVFREVPIEIRTYYKVVLADEDGVAASSGAPDLFRPDDRVPPAPSGSVDELPGAFPLGSSATPSPFEPTEPPAPQDGRRATRFGRGG